MNFVILSLVKNDLTNTFNFIYCLVITNFLIKVYFLSLFFIAIKKTGEISITKIDNSEKPENEYKYHYEIHGTFFRQYFLLVILVLLSFDCNIYIKQNIK